MRGAGMIWVRALRRSKEVRGMHGGDWRVERMVCVCGTTMASRSGTWVCGVCGMKSLVCGCDGARGIVSV
ncbi:hypothetical protein EON65_39520 [archaeon]|nr:MAG: hypothetical protein EON65_39520 [archaeon]